MRPPPADGDAAGLAPCGTGTSPQQCGRDRRRRGRASWPAESGQAARPPARGAPHAGGQPSCQARAAAGGGALGQVAWRRTGKETGRAEGERQQGARCLRMPNRSRPSRSGASVACARGGTAVGCGCGRRSSRSGRRRCVLTRSLPPPPRPPAAARLFVRPPRSHNSVRQTSAPIRCIVPRRSSLLLPFSSQLASCHAPPRSLVPRPLAVPRDLLFVCARSASGSAALLPRFCFLFSFNSFLPFVFGPIRLSSSLSLSLYFLFFCFCSLVFNVLTHSLVWNLKSPQHHHHHHHHARR